MTARALVPVQCPGCGMEDVRWCETCAALWWERPWRCEEGARRLAIDMRVTLPVWTIAPLEGPAHHMIGGWKDGSRRDLDHFFADAIERAAVYVAACLVSVGEVAVVPLPSRQRSTRRRGVDLPGILAHATARGLVSEGVAACVGSALRIGSGESRMMGARQRWRNTRAALSVFGQAPRRPVVLVDDVITTGATMATATAVLEQAGCAVVAGLTLAARGLPGRM